MWPIGSKRVGARGSTLSHALLRNVDTWIGYRDVGRNYNSIWIVFWSKLESVF